MASKKELMDRLLREAITTLSIIQDREGIGPGGQYLNLLCLSGRFVEAAEHLRKYNIMYLDDNPKCEGG